MYDTLSKVKKNKATGQKFVNIKKDSPLEVGDDVLVKKVIIEVNEID